MLQFLSGLTKDFDKDEWLFSNFSIGNDVTSNAETSRSLSNEFAGDDERLKEKSEEETKRKHPFGSTIGFNLNEL
jgi:hypothetical protein